MVVLSEQIKRVSRLWVQVPRPDDLHTSVHARARWRRLPLVVGSFRFHVGAQWGTSVVSGDAGEGDLVCRAVVEFTVLRRVRDS